MKKVLLLLVLLIVFAVACSSSNFGIKPGDRLLSAIFMSLGNQPAFEPKTSDGMVRVMMERVSKQGDRVAFFFTTITEANGSTLKLTGQNKESSEIEKIEGQEITFKKDPSADKSLSDAVDSHSYLFHTSDARPPVSPCEVIIGTNKALGGNWFAFLASDYKDGKIVIRWINPSTGGSFTATEWANINRDDLEITDYVVAPPTLKAKICEPGRPLIACGCN